MNVYDFDRTIYPGDSSIHFWRFCMLHYPKTMRVIPRATAAMVRYKRKRCTWSDVMEVFFTFLRHVPDVREAVDAFWDKNADKIYEWYLDRKHEADVIISADFKHHVIAMALEEGLSVIAMTHYASEYYGFRKFYKKIGQSTQIPCVLHADEILL